MPAGTELLYKPLNPAPHEKGTGPDAYPVRKVVEPKQDADAPDGAAAAGIVMHLVQPQVQQNEHSAVH